MSEAHRVLDEAFEQFHLRLVELRLTPAQFIKDMAPVSYQTYWRNRSSQNKYHSPVPARTKTLAKLEEALRNYELQIAQENYEAKIA